MLHYALAHVVYHIDLFMKVALFDFDGTITSHDTFIRFALFSQGKIKFIKAMLQSMPYLLAWKLHLRSNSQAKERLFKALYEGMDYEEFKEWCILFRDKINMDLRPETLAMMQWHKAQGHTIAIVSASISDWILPWSQTLGVDHVLATEIELTESQKISGRFSTPNCHGKEKVRRIKEDFMLGSDDEIWAYGDSKGDDEMLSIANHPHKI